MATSNHTGRYTSRRPEEVGRPLTPAAQQVLEVASELFYERGIHAVGVEAIAAGADVTKKTLYDRFGSKDALISAYLTRRDDEYRRWVDTWVGEIEGNASEQLLAVFDALDDWMRQRSPRGCAFVNAFAELPAEDHPGRNVAVAQKEWLHDYFSRLMARAGLSDSDDLSRQLLTLHEGAIVAYSVGAYVDAARTAKRAAAVLIAAAEPAAVSTTD